MTQVSVRRTIHAPAEVVFQAVTDIGNLPATSPDIVKVEFLSEQRSGLGTRFRETRMMNGKEFPTELEVTEFVPHERARMVADTNGTIWDTTFTIRPQGAECELEIRMEARAHKFLPKLLNPLMKGFFRKGIEKHIVGFGAYCESLAAESAEA